MRRTRVRPAPQGRAPARCCASTATSSRPTSPSSARRTPSAAPSRSSARGSARSSRSGKEIDFAIGVQGLGRFRVNLFQQRGTLGFVFRAIPFEIPSLARPHAARRCWRRSRSRRAAWCWSPGVTGSGKITTLAAMLRHLNESRAVNIVTIEDPIEFLHRDHALAHQPARGGHRHALLPRRAPPRPAAGPGRDHARRDPRPRLHGDGAQGGQHRPPGDVHAAHHRRQPDDRPRHLVLPAAPARGDPRPARGLAARRSSPCGSSRARTATGACRRWRSSINTAAVSERIRAGDQIHTLRDLIAEGRTPVRHADLRPEPDGPLPATG